MPRRLSLLAALPALLGAPSACATAQSPAQAPTASAPAQPQQRPSLVVLITVDQFRADYLQRFRPQLTGGLARLLKGGAVFTDAHHDHAITETAPGHATLLSGRFPASTGIMLNRAGVDDDNFPLLEGAEGGGASPLRFAGTGLVDWMRARDRSTRFLSVSMKDRGAILPVGRAKGDVYWYSPDGRFVTSRYYGEALPSWVVEFNNRRMPQRYAGTSWSLLLPASEYPERDSVVVEGGGRDVVFPHRLPADSVLAANLVRGTPFIDEVTTAFALHGVQKLGIGDDRRSDGRTDLLAVSLSATDVIGHRFGPDSREMHDQVLRDDRVIGAFLDSLYKLRDSTRIVIAFSSDHGVGTIPEIASMADPLPLPFPERVSLYGLLPAVRAKLRAAKVDTFALEIDEQIVVLNRAAFRRSKLDPDSLLDAFAAEIRKTPGVQRVDRLRALVADSARDPIARRWLHQFPTTLNVELVVTLTPFSTWGGNVASHGSPHPYDSGVPIIFAGAGVRAGTYPQFVRTVDLAPTLAALLGVRPTERLDGVVLGDAIAKP